jgi:hypothetical protein
LLQNKLPHFTDRSIEMGQGRLSISSDRNDGSGIRLLDQPAQQRQTQPPLFSRVATIGHRIVWLMRVEWKNIPKKNRSLQAVKYLPNYRSGSFTNLGAVSRPGKGSRAKQSSMIRKMNFVSKRQSGTPPAPVAQVACYPIGAFKVEIILILSASQVTCLIAMQFPPIGRPVRFISWGISAQRQVPSAGFA